MKLFESKEPIFKKTGDGLLISTIRAKQVGAKNTTKFLVPFNRVDPTICFATYVLNYLDQVYEYLEMKPDEHIWKGCYKNKGFVNQNLGKNMIYLVGKDIVKQIELEKWSEYTGHAFRRSAATEAANNGATTTQLKKGFNWTNEKTALRYI